MLHFRVYRKHIGVVPQDVVLFNDTVRLNLLYGKPEASDAELVEASKKAQLYDVIENLPNVRKLLPLCVSVW